MRLRLTEGEDGLRRLSEKLDAFAARQRLAPDVRRDLHLSVDEVVNNIVRHAHPRHPDVVIEVAVVDDALEIRIADDGDPFDPTGRPDPDTTLPLEERPIGGLGIFLVRQLMSDVRYRRSRGRNRLVLRRRLTASTASAV